MAAPVHAAVARLDVAHEPLVAAEREVRVALERRQQVACRQLELAPAELDERLVRSRVGRTAGRQLADPRRQRRLVLAGDRAVGQRADREVAAHRRVEAVEADRQLGARAANAGRRPHRQAHRGVHRHREAGGLRPLECAGVPALDRQVEAAHLVPGPTQRSRRRGHVQRLVAELVGRDEQDAHRFGA